MAELKTNKEQRYDRQLRLWGDHGQDALEGAHVCLINATATGTEILKNLVLPGIGAFTIVDGHKVTGEDIGNNFFLSSDSIEKSRAQAATELLQELNSDVSGNFVEEDADKLLENDPEFFNRFSLVISVQLPESVYLKLACVLWKAGVPFLVCRTYGLVGYMRLAVKEHTVVESHPDSALEDLRLDSRFTELKNHISSYDLDSMDKKDHSHTPWIIIISKYLEKWLSEHDFQLPKSYKEKEEFRRLIRDGIRTNENGILEEEENFDEAIKNVNTALNPTKICSNVEEIFSSEQCENITSQTPAFWVMARGVRDFVQNEGNGKLPLRGTIPDMISDSDKFINLQNVYREKAMQDASVVAKHIRSHLQAVGKPAESISEQDIRLFSSCMDNPDSEMVLYLMLRSVDRFYQQHSRYPGVYNYQVEEDISRLKVCVNSLLQEYMLNVNVKDDYIHEFCRYGAAEPHTVAALLGGVSSVSAVSIQ
ncbi:hypothetical protein QTP70_030449 [Hemibagrus guttatus]|uniref:NEDD8-activating enzyme E1 regulatory subunit n=1 Tax=Hemibagrus guttatus TaxID=175788 RepID=A0AAE0ULI9_9TELE|nr:hypothetical protein QTP70_030449 [Hemibagrus guttatus]